MPEPVVPTTSTDPKVVTMVVTYIGATVLLGLALIGALLILSQVTHDKVDTATLAILSGLTGTALGALGTLLASTRSGDPIPPQVQDVLTKLSASEKAEMVARLKNPDSGPTTVVNRPVVNVPAGDTMLPGTDAGPPAVWDAPPV